MITALTSAIYVNTFILFYFRHKICKHEEGSEGCWVTRGFACCYEPTGSELGMRGCAWLHPCCKRRPQSQGCKHKYMCCGTVVPDGNRNSPNNKDNTNEGCKEFCIKCNAEWGSKTNNCSETDHTFKE